MARPLTPRSMREEQLSRVPGATFVGWRDGYRNAHSKAIMVCDYGHEWVASVSHLVDVKCATGCPKCSNKYRPSQREREDQLNSLPRLTFICWQDGCYRNAQSRATMMCDVGHAFSAAANHLVNTGSGCPTCAGVGKYSSEERMVQLGNLPGMEFVRWDGEYLNCYSKAVMRCDVSHEWAASITNLLNGRGCPSCAKSGYDPSKPGTLYALRHENGAHIKIGISNAHSRRLAELRRATPFKFEPISLHHSDDGRVIADLEKVFHQNFESSGFSGFDGATEWLKFNPDILTIMRILGA